MSEVRGKKFTRHPLPREGTHESKGGEKWSQWTKPSLNAAIDLLPILWGVCRQSWLLLPDNKRLVFQIVSVIQLLFSLIPWNGNAVLLSKLHKQHDVERKSRRGKMSTTIRALKTQLGPLSTGHILSPEQKSVFFIADDIKGLSLSP